VYYYPLIMVLLFPLIYLVKFCKPSLFSRRRGLRLPPGPWQIPIIGSLHHLRGSLPHRALRDLSLRYGPLMFLKFGQVPVVVASTPEAAKEIMRTRDAVFASRPLSFTKKIILKDGPGIAWAPYGDHWRQLRKVCIMELLSAKRVHSFRPVREEEAIRLVQSIIISSKKTSSSVVVNLSKLIAMFVADASVHAIMGNANGRFQHRDTLLQYVDEGVRLAGGLTPVDLFPSSWFVRLLTRAPQEAEDFRQSLSTFMDGVIRGHQGRRSHGDQKDQPEDLIDVLLRIQREGSLQFPLSMSIIKAVIFVSFGAAIFDFFLSLITI
jgi:cytochrome P450